MAEKHISLPRFIVLKHQRNNKYLIHVSDNHDKLQFSGTDFGNLHVKYEVVKSSKEDGLVHLKCCYNRMYWVCRQNQNWIYAEAREMEEDESKWSCTLFKPVFFTSNRIGFCHVHIKKNVMFSDTRPFCLYVGTPKYEADYLDFFDWAFLPILPRYIALKDKHGNYLSAYQAPQNLVEKVLNNPVMDFINKIPGVVNPFSVPSAIVKASVDENVYLRFYCNERGDQTVGNEVFTTPDGKIRLKSNHIGKFWRASPTWIWPDSDDETNNDPATLFEVKVDQNKISLKNLGNNMFCRSFTADGKNDCLNANSETKSETAMFTVEELVDKRNIYNVRFHEKAARIYEKEILNEVQSSNINNTEVAQQGTLEIEYTKEETRTWTTSNSLKQTVQTEITVAPVDVVEGKLSYAREETKTVDNGMTLNSKVGTKFTRNINIPPNSKVVAHFRVTQALCDVPYSYSVSETLTNGTPITNERDDGLYTSVRTYVDYEIKQE